MLPLINGKSFLSCAESDLLVLLDNEEYRENEYIDYKLIKTDDSYDSDRVLKQLQIAFLLAIGVKYNESLKQLIDDVYGN